MEMQETLLPFSLLPFLRSPPPSSLKTLGKASYNDS